MTKQDFLATVVPAVNGYLAEHRSVLVKAFETCGVVPLDAARATARVDALTAPTAASVHVTASHRDAVVPGPVGEHGYGLGWGVWPCAYACEQRRV